MIPCCLPHACGGVSLDILTVSVYSQSSPRLWGCFRTANSRISGQSVFPTPVGVFLQAVLAALEPISLPHACGGVSVSELQFVEREMSSPRLWGCFQAYVSDGAHGTVFPTPVGVFLRFTDIAPDTAGLPHACGGVSQFREAFALQRLSSPRLWGCFQSGQGLGGRGAVFPTPVGVFPFYISAAHGVAGLPHPPVFPEGE